VADLVTHLCTGLLLKAVTGGRWVGPVALGTALPDISSRLPTMVLDGVIRMGVPLPLPVLYPWAVLHMPFGNLGLCGVLAFLFPKAQRAKVFLWLLIGSWLHFGVDLLQGHHGEGYYMFFPLSQARCELGVMGSEATVPFAPVLAAVTIVAWALRWHQKKGSGR
jgi:hypothetical protein